MYLLGLISTYKTGRRAEGDVFTLSDVFQSQDWHQLSLQHHSASDYGFYTVLCTPVYLFDGDWKAVMSKDEIKLSFSFVQWTIGDPNKEGCKPVRLALSYKFKFSSLKKDEE